MNQLRAVNWARRRADEPFFVAARTTIPDEICAGRH
jgi:hypothetical protein